MAEIRKLDRMTLVRDFNLFPMPDKLLNLERKYGDSLSHEDLYGEPQKPKRRRQAEETLSVNFADDTLGQKSITAYSHMTGSQYDKKSATADNLQTTKKREKTVNKGQTDDKNADFEETLK
jgi:hypothetical protein